MHTFKTHMINTNTGTFNIQYHLNSPSSDELHGQLGEPPPREVKKRATLSTSNSLDAYKKARPQVPKIGQDVLC